MSTIEQSVTKSGATRSSSPASASQPVPPLKPLSPPDLSRFEKALVRVNEELSPPVEQFAQAVDAVDCIETTVESDRRSFPRRESGCFVAVCCDANVGSQSGHQTDWMLHSSQLKGKLLDISMNGVAFVLNESMQKDEGMLLRLINRRFDESIDTAATVIRCSRYETGEWKIVCRFGETLTFEQIHMIARQLESDRLV